jgi:site-specific recombinase XerD
MRYMDEKLKLYLDWKGTYAHRASINYRKWLEYFIKLCGQKNLEEYDVNDIVKYRNWLESRYSSYSTQFAIVILKNFFQFFKYQDYACISPSLIRIPRVNQKSHRAITEDEFNKIISVIPSNEFLFLRDLIMIRMLWDTGVRVSELCDIDITNIDEHKTSAIISTKKTGKKRIIVWSKETHELLMKYMPIRLELHKRHKTTSLFIGTEHGKGWSVRLTSRSVQRRVLFYVSKAGIKEKITPHSFRHGWAHKRRDQNAPLAFIQRGLGHISPVSTFIYEQYCDNEFENKAISYLT